MCFAAALQTMSLKPESIVKSKGNQFYKNSARVYNINEEQKESEKNGMIRLLKKSQSHKPKMVLPKELTGLL